MVKENSTCTLAGAWCFGGAGGVGKRTFSLFFFFFLKIEGTRILLMEHTFMPKTVEVKNILLKNLEV